MGLRVFVFDEDKAFLKLLTVFLESKGHSVSAFTSKYDCPLFQGNQCECPATERCADAVIVNVRPPTMSNIGILIEQDSKGCKLPKQNKAVVSSQFTNELEAQIKAEGFHTMRKPSRLCQIDQWLNECDDRLKSCRR